MVARTVFRNGSLFDGHRYRGPVGAVLIEDGVIAAVFTADNVEELPAGAVDVDLGGGLLAPGFVDAHVHVVQGGLERIRCDLTGLHGRDEYLAAVASYAADHPEEEWVLGGGWSMTAFPGGTPTAADLDQVVGDRPVFLPNRDHHGAWVNTRALVLAGVQPDAPDPPHGRFERDAFGVPTGTLHEGAMRVVAQHIPATTEQEYDRALLAGQAYLQSVGVVGWQDALIGDYAGTGDPGPVYLRAARRGSLTAHVVGALWWDRDLGPEQIAGLVQRRAELSHGRFQASSVKIMQDGVAENGTAALGAPYLDDHGQPTANTGHSFLEPERLKAAIAALAAEGFPVHVHAIGDRAVQEALDAFAHAAGAERDLRHQIAHLQVIDPTDLPRFAALGVAADLQAFWACLDEQMVELTLPYLDQDRAGWQYPFGDLHRAGARLVMGSDWPVSTPDPLAAIHVAVNRTVFGELGRAGTEPFLPEQRLSLETAFAAYTSGSAWVNHRDGAGLVAPGLVADLVVLDRDPFAAPASEIGAAQVVSTWVAGEPVFTR